MSIDTRTDPIDNLGMTTETTTRTQTTTSHHYFAVSPRGFNNETTVYVVAEADSAAFDRYLDDTYGGDVNASVGRVSSDQVRRHTASGYWGWAGTHYADEHTSETAKDAAAELLAKWWRDTRLVPGKNYDVDGFGRLTYLGVRGGMLTFERLTNADKVFVEPGGTLTAGVYSPPAA